MAAHSNGLIRVRLLFDFPPPAAVDCRKCWLLVDLNRCRVVSDLESLIRDKFEFSRRAVLNLFIDDCYLPHTESVHVVRDNDGVRVEVDHLPVVNGHSSSTLTESETCRKRRRPEEEDGEHLKKKKKKKKRREESQERIDQRAQGSAKTPEKKEKTKQKDVNKNPAAAVKTTSAKTSPKPAAKPQRASSSDSSSSEEDPAPKKTAPKKQAPKPATLAPPTQPAPKVPQSLKKKLPSSSSSETSSEEEQSVKPPPKKASNPHAPKTSSSLKPQPPSNPSTSTAPPAARPTQASSSESEEEIQLVIKRPLHPTQQLGRGVGVQPPWRGRGRGKARGGAPAERGGAGGGRGRGNNFHFNYNGAEEPTYQSDSLTNASVVIQNGAENVPRPDYSSMPLLAAPPQVGQKIAFKLLELTENYTPEVSEYKEGKIVSFDSNSKQVELELLHAFQAPVEPGKFDLVYQNPDGSERVEYAVTRDLRVTERWESLLEPRLII